MISFIFTKVAWAIAIVWLFFIALMIYALIDIKKQSLTALNLFIGHCRAGKHDSLVNILYKGELVMNKLQDLYARKVYLEALIREASINGEANSRIERLEDKLRDIEREINVENIRAYS